MANGEWSETVRCPMYIVLRNTCRSIYWSTNILVLSWGSSGTSYCLADACCLALGDNNVGKRFVPGFLPQPRFYVPFYIFQFKFQIYRYWWTFLYATHAFVAFAVGVLSASCMKRHLLCCRVASLGRTSCRFNVLTLSLVSRTSPMAKRDMTQLVFLVFSCSCVAACPKAQSKQAWTT